LVRNLPQFRVIVVTQDVQISGRLIGQAMQAMRAGQYAEAAQRFRQALEMDPVNAAAAAGLGTIALESGHAGEAVALFERALVGEPDNADHRSNLGMAYFLTGREEDGKAAFRRALDIRPGHADAAYNLGLAAAKEDAFEEAHGLFSKVVRRQPKNAEAVMNLGLACLKLGRTDEARKHLRKATVLAPGNLLAGLNYGNVLLSLDRIGEAARVFEALAASRGDVPEIEFGLARCHQFRGDMENAIAALHRAVALRQDFFEAHLELGRVLHGQMRLDEAEVHSRKAVALAHADEGPLFNLAELLMSMGRTDEGFEAFSKMLEINPRSTKALCAIASHRQRLGAFDVAREIITTIKAIDPTNREAYRLQSMDGDFPFDTEDLGAIERILADRAVDETAKTRLGFVLATIYDRRSDHDRAFAAAKRANQSVERGVDYDADGLDARVADIEATFDAAFFERHAALGAESTKPVFIIGMPRSGTSLIEKILTSHSLVEGAGELTHFNLIKECLPSRIGGDDGYPACLERLPPEIASETARDYLRYLDGVSSTAQHVTDKMPENYWNVGLIHLLLPDAKFIYCDRDPMDTCLSIYFQDFSERLPYACSFPRIAHYYRLHRRLMTHWHRIGIPIHVVDYAALLDDAPGRVAAMLDFMNLPWEDACLSFHESAARVETASMWQVRQPLYRASLGRWRHYAQHLGDLRALLATNEPG
jgi:tetratricopeptide (TPR) repeat protein